VIFWGTSTTGDACCDFRLPTASMVSDILGIAGEVAEIAEVFYDPGRLCD